ncbi:F0F1 ATP synthase subunit epsilon [Dehalococcoidia bacterium]|nr:F0F1 ATP synthase subunit epsilon [Dehalococcoidia bacterium]
MSDLDLKIVTAEGEMFSGRVGSVTAPGDLGEFTVLPSHVRIISSLSAGELRFKHNNENQSLAISGGFFEVKNDVVIVLADTAERDDDIDIERAEIAVQKARERLDNTSSDIDLERAIQSMRRAQVRLRVGKKRRSGTTSLPRQ